MKTKLILLLIAVIFGLSGRLGAQNIITVAGNGTDAMPVNGALAISSPMLHPVEVAVDGKGNIYFADSIYYVYRINQEGIINLVAGSGISGFFGDGGPATNAQFGEIPIHIAADKYGNIYICDPENSRVRKVDTFGIISTIAGSTTATSIGDGGPATAAIVVPYSIATDIRGNVYIGEFRVGYIRKIDASGIITTIGGNGTTIFSGDGGPATDAGIVANEMTADSNGNLFFIDYDYRIRKISNSGIVTTIGGTGTSGFSGDGGAATSAELFAGAIVAGKYNSLYFSDESHRIREIDSNGLINTIAGNGIAGYTGDGGTATDAEINIPGGIAIDYGNNIYFGDETNLVIRKICNCTVNAVSQVANKTTLAIFPNPSNGQFAVSLPGVNSPITITIANILGESIQIRKINAFSGLHESFYLKDIPRGTYLVKVEAGGSIYRDKVVINK